MPFRRLVDHRWTKPAVLTASTAFSGLFGRMKAKPIDLSAEVARSEMAGGNHEFRRGTLERLFEVSLNANGALGPIRGHATTDGPMSFREATATLRSPDTRAPRALRRFSCASRRRRRAS
jgi:hypothetical protein